MSITTRKQREKEEMRELILEAARNLFLEKGYELTSIRSIAEKIDYSPGTIYLYYKDKDEIFHALHEGGFRKMLEKMQPLAFVEDPFERLKALGRIYIDFAQNNPDYYDLMFIMQAPIKHEEEHEKWEMGHRTLNALKDIIRQCQEKGRFRDMDLNFLSFTIWSGVHGMCALVVRERCRAYHDENLQPAALLENGYKNFVAMLEKL